MKRASHPVDDFFLNPPWNILFGVGGFLLVSIFALLRISEFGSAEKAAACRAALLVAGIVGGLGMWPIVTGWGKSGWRIVGGILAGGMIRLLLTPVGIIIIFAFTDVDRLWLLVFTGITYVVFLGADTAIGIMMLKRVRWNEDVAGVHGNLWNCISP